MKCKKGKKERKKEGKNSNVKREEELYDAQRAEIKRGLNILQRILYRMKRGCCKREM